MSSLIRNPDGTAWEGHVSYRWPAVHMKYIGISITKENKLPLDTVYGIYGVCSALEVFSPLSTKFGQTDAVILFLHGHTLNELTMVKEKEPTSLTSDIDEYVYAPTDWRLQNVKAMDWNNFCLSYYTFLISECSVNSQVWKSMCTIFQILKNSPELLSMLLAKDGRAFDEGTCAVFWDTVRSGIKHKLLRHMNAGACYTAFSSYRAIRKYSFFGFDSEFETEFQQKLEKFARRRLDKIARSKVPASPEDFDLEQLFFLKEFFEVFPNAALKEEIADISFSLMLSYGDYYCLQGDNSKADKFYVAAIEYACTESTQELIRQKRCAISPAFATAKQELEKELQEREQKNMRSGKKQRLHGVGGIVMNWFGSKKKPSSPVVWRDSSGVIRCLGDRCPQKNCDDTCPIWLNTMAASVLATGEIKSALAYLEKASKIAPDFYDAWNNMGGMHGQLGNYKQAYDCYIKAHSINPESFQPVFGLALASRDLNLFEECLRWCDEYDRLCTDHRCDDVRSVASTAMFRDRVINEFASSQTGCSPASVCAWLLEEGKKDGFVPDDKAFPNIPEIMSQARTVVLQILAKMQEASPESFVTLTPCWAAYAAMGAVRFWNDDWDSLSKNGILPSLIAPRGFDEMDEFVTDYIGWKYGSKRSNEFVEHIRFLGAVALARINKLNDGNNEKYMEAYTNMLMGFFYYGMIIEMHELGMH